MEFDSFLLLDRMDKPDQGTHAHNPSKYLVYNDVFTGLMDSLCAEVDNAYYVHLAKEIRAVQEQGNYAHLFRKYAALCDFLALKSELGMKTRALYASSDREGMKALANGDYIRAIEALEAFHAAFQDEWFADNKPHGFDV